MSVSALKAPFSINVSVTLLAIFVKDAEWMDRSFGRPIRYIRNGLTFWECDTWHVCSSIRKNSLHDNIKLKRFQIFSVFLARLINSEYGEFDLFRQALLLWLRFDWIFSFSEYVDCKKCRYLVFVIFRIEILVNYKFLLLILLSVCV